MTGQEAIAYIHSYNWLGSKPGLERTQELLERMGHPEKGLRFVHVLGTNGKGSTSAMLASVLQAAGYVTGLYTSPYLARFHERMQVNGVPITDEELAQATEATRPFAEAMAQHPTEFELVTAVAFTYFRQKGCDIVVLEAGLGGRLDSTNAIPSPEAVVLTRIGLDHTAELGNTQEAIAAEKAAVVKPGCSVVAYQQDASVMEVFEEACRRADTRMRTADFSQLRVLQDNLEGQVFDYGALEGLRIALLGPHQRCNAAVVIETVQALRERGWVITEDALRQGLAQARWPGRFELVSRSPRFIVDGGHNPQCAQSVADGLQDYFPGEKAVFLIGVLADKDYCSLTACLAPLAKCFVTVTPDSGRALEAAELGRLLEEAYGLPVTVCQSIEQGVETAKKLAGPEGLAVSVGSLYLTGAVRTCFGLT